KLKCYGDVKTENLKIKRIEYDKRIYEKLHLSKEAKVYKLLRVRSLDNFRIAYHISYLNGEVFKNLNNDGEDIREIRDYYEKNNIKEVIYEDIKLKVKYAGREIRYILKCGELVPIIYSEQRVLEEKRVIEYTEIFYRGDIFEFEI
ncbi:MAG: UTRA domain-containing protein, partial [Clostridium sp.]|uniref:UTRA domain-containing protein n=1 Tax=Clostridium sp. TaxID=1506 RepID=UPI003F2D2BB6